MLLMFSHLDDRMNFSSFLVFLIYGILELVSMGNKSLVSHLGQGTFVYFVKIVFWTWFPALFDRPMFSCT